MGKRRRERKEGVKEKKSYPFLSYRKKIQFKGERSLIDVRCKIKIGSHPRETTKRSIYFSSTRRKRKNPSLLLKKKRNGKYKAMFLKGS